MTLFHQVTMSRRRPLACNCAQGLVLRIPSLPWSGALRAEERGMAKLASTAMLQILYNYRRYLTDNMPPNCRFQPSCSKYMIEAITTYGAWRGFILSAWRVIRCNPTGGAGYDPVQWPPVDYRAGSWTE